MKIYNLIIVAVSILISASSAIASDLCGIAFAEDDATAIVQPAIDLNWMICLLHRRGIDDGKGSIRVTVREREVAPQPSVANDLFDGVTIREISDDPYLENCAVFGVKSNEVLAIVRTAGVPNNRAVKVCPR